MIWYKKAKSNNFISLGKYGPDDYPDDKIEEAIKILINRLGSAKGINSGNCDLFANELVSIIGGELIETNESSNLPSHMFVKRKGMFFDAETPQGVNNPFELPIFKRSL